MSGYPYHRSDFEQASNGIRPYADISWFAADCKGRLGIFLTAGFGVVPIASLRLFDLHKQAYCKVLGVCNEEAKDIIEIHSHPTGEEPGG